MIVGGGRGGGGRGRSKPNHKGRRRQLAEDSEEIENREKDQQVKKKVCFVKKLSFFN